MFLPWSWGPQVLSDASYVDGLVQLAALNPYPLTRDGFCAQLQACEDFDGRPLLHDITAPALVLGGQHDRIAPPHVLHHLAHSLGAPLAFGEAGHNAHLEARPWFLNQVLRFID
jgi:pimeloyl-ACP methyl ester carboxylesterase